MNEISLNNYIKDQLRKIILIPIFLFYFLISFSQVLSENDIKQLAQKVNTELAGMDIGNGVTVRRCYAFGRTLVYQYDVPEYWQAPENIKEVLIANQKTAGAAKNYFLHAIDVDFYYYKGNSLVEKVSIKSNEFSTYNFELGEYLSIKDHPKSKDVNLKLKVPIGWKVEEGDRPNIVKKFTKGGNTYLILIKENMTFFSRNETRDLLSDESFVTEFVQETSSVMKNSEILEKSIVTIDTYPTLQFKVSGKMERSGITIPMVMKCWVVFFEDKIVFLQSMGINNAEFRALEQLYFLITNSVIFPDQYN